MKKEGFKKEVKKEVLFNAPNVITLFRLFLVFVIVYMLFSGFSRFFIGIIFIIGALSDYFDGLVARRFRQTTRIGARMDEVIDRIFTVCFVIAFAIYLHINNQGSNILFLILIMSREIIAIPGVIIRIIRKRDVYSVKYIGKLTTFIQGVALAMLILNFTWLEFNWILFSAIITCFFGIISGFDYLKDSLIK